MKGAGAAVRVLQHIMFFHLHLVLRNMNRWMGAFLVHYYIFMWVIICCMWCAMCGDTFGKGLKKNKLKILNFRLMFEMIWYFFLKWTMHQCTIIILYFGKGFNFFNGIFVKDRGMERDEIRRAYDLTHLKGGRRSFFLITTIIILVF